MRRFFPVVHCTNKSAAMKAIKIVETSGADGFFLIDQGKMQAKDVVGLAWEVAREGALPVGLNLLGLSANEVAMKVDGSSIALWWADNALIPEMVRVETPPKSRSRSPADILRGLEFFGGVAFKYQPFVPDDRLEHEISLSKTWHVDVVTTSGPGTGKPANVDRVRQMFEHVQKLNATGGRQQRLGLASGVTVDNVGEFLPYVDDFLVGTGIEKDFGVLDPGRVKALADQIHKGP